MMPRPVTGNRGFTLIEVLIAMSVLGVVMTAVFTLFSSGMKLRTVTRDRMAFDREARLVMGALADDLAHLVPAGPAPMVSTDSIVLLRRQTKSGAETGQIVVPQLVTYQWSGSTFQDSLLVRVAAPLTVDVSAYEEVYQAFMKWARVYQGSDSTDSFLLREDAGARFGTRATLNGLSGSWEAFPRVQGFACGIAEDPDPTEGKGLRSRIRVRLSPEQFPSSFPGLDPLIRLALLPENSTGLETGFWLPLTAQVPVILDGDLPGEVQP